MAAKCFILHFNIALLSTAGAVMTTVAGEVPHTDSSFPAQAPPSVWVLLAPLLPKLVAGQRWYFECHYSLQMMTMNRGFGDLKWGNIKKE